MYNQTFFVVCETKKFIFYIKSYQLNNPQQQLTDFDKQYVFETQ